VRYPSGGGWVLACDCDARYYGTILLSKTSIAFAGRLVVAILMLHSAAEEMRFREQKLPAKVLRRSGLHTSDLQGGGQTHLSRRLTGFLFFVRSAAAPPRGTHDARLEPLQRPHNPPMVEPTVAVNKFQQFIYHALDPVFLIPVGL